MRKNTGTAVLLECYVGFVHVGYDSSCSYVFVHFVNDTQMNMYSLNVHAIDIHTVQMSVSKTYQL